MVHKLPELFQTIIRQDERLATERREPVPNLAVFRSLKKYRRELTIAAEGFVRKQRGP